MTTPITAQMIFNAAWQEFIVNKAPPAVKEFSTGESDYKYGCCYLTPDGRKCAVGLCIPDNHELQKSVKSLACMAAENPSLFNLTNQEKIYLQSDLHDNLISLDTGKWRYSHADMRTMYLEVAKRCNLTVPGE